MSEEKISELETLHNKIYKETEEYGRTQFVSRIVDLEYKAKELEEKANNRYKAIKDQEKFIIKLDSDTQKYFNMYADESIKNRYLEEKYNKALELLSEYQMPCDIDEFNIKNTDYCSSNCSVDEEVYKKCWNRYIEQELDKEEK